MIESTMNRASQSTMALMEKLYASGICRGAEPSPQLIGMASTAASTQLMTPKVSPSAITIQAIIPFDGPIARIAAGSGPLTE